jgi:hypothetical protein
MSEDAAKAYIAMIEANTPQPNGEWDVLARFHIGKVAAAAVMLFVDEIRRLREMAGAR